MKKNGLLILIMILTFVFSAVAAAYTQETPYVADLIAGGGKEQSAIDVGGVSVWNDDDSLYIKYLVDNPWCMTETHLEVGTSLDAIPQTKKGNPIPGKFQYSNTHSCITQFTVQTPLNNWESGTELTIAAHATVKKLTTIINDIPQYLYESAWGKGFEFPGKNWATYFAYTIQAVQASSLRITDITPDSALPGNLVTVNIEGRIEDSPLKVVFHGRDIPTTPAISDPDAMTFQIPEGAKSGPLYVVQGDRSSNAIWFSISPSILIPAPEDVVQDEDGNDIAVNLVVVSMKKEFNSIEEAQRVAALRGGVVVGQLPLILGYQVRIPTNTLEELKAAVLDFETDPSVNFVLVDIAIGNDAVDWTNDPENYFQRDTNQVEEGAALYTEKVHPTEVGKIIPLFTSVGIIEEGTDFNVDDFDNYGENGTARLNNISIYAKDIDWETENGIKKLAHGTQVTGIVAAEIGNGHDVTGNTGKMAGLLQGLQNSHGGFNIVVKKSARTDDGESWVSALIKKTEEMLEDGVRVVNWSFGVHKKGAIQSDGNPVDDNIREEFFFERVKKGFEAGIKTIETKYPLSVIVASAGNGNTSSTDANFRTPSAIESDSMIVVGAHNASNSPDKTTYTDYGTRVDIAACGNVLVSDGSYAAGTSLAAPLVTATIATMQSINPDLSPKEIKLLLRKSALPININEVTLYDSNSEKIGEDVFTAPLTEAEVGEENADKGARLNVKGAIQAAIDSLDTKTILIGEPIDVTLPFGSGDITKSVAVKVPEGTVFDKVDILFLVDVSSSYDDDIAQFREKAADLVDAFLSAGRDVQIALASFSDFPILPYGGSGDYAYSLDQELTSDQSKIMSAINGLTIKNGSDYPEGQLEALYQAATGLGRTVTGYPYANIPASSVGWRKGALPLICLATDASFHDSDSESSYPGAGWEQTIAELKNRKIQVFGLQSGSQIGDVVDIVNETGGEAFTLSGDSAEIVNAVITAIDNASSKVNIKLISNGDFGDLIQSIAPEDGYQNVEAGETKTFDVTFSRHFWESDPTADHIFALRLLVEAEGVAIIEEIPVTVHVTFR